MSSPAKTTQSSSSSSSSKKRKAEQGIEMFLKDTLPSLKKEMSKKKREPFRLDEYNEYFKDSSKIIPTFMLPLFRFVQKTEVVCSRYGCFNGKHMVKCAEGFNRVMLLTKHADPEQFTPDVQQYCAQRFGKEWFKIPAKDGYRAKAAAAAGHDGLFKVVLTGVFFDSFIDKNSHDEIQTINPVLMFEACPAPVQKKQKVSLPTPPPSEKKSRKRRKKNEEEDEKLEEVESEQKEEQKPEAITETQEISLAQETELSPLEEEDSE